MSAAEIFFERLDQLSGDQLQLWVSPEGDQLSLESDGHPEIDFLVYENCWLVSCIKLESPGEPFSPELVAHLLTQTGEWFEATRLTLGGESETGVLSLCKIQGASELDPQQYLESLPLYFDSARRWSEWLRDTPNDSSGPFPSLDLPESAPNGGGDDHRQSLIGLSEEWNRRHAEIPLNEESEHLEIRLGDFGQMTIVPHGALAKFSYEMPVSEGEDKESFNREVLFGNFLYLGSGGSTLSITPDSGLHFQSGLSLQNLDYPEFETHLETFLENLWRWRSKTSDQTEEIVDQDVLLSNSHLRI